MNNISTRVTIEDVRSAATKEKNMTRGLKMSGFLLEEWVAQRFPQMKRMPPKSAYDFTFGTRKIDVKMCLASKYGGNIFVEVIQNTDFDSESAHMKEDIVLMYVDILTQEIWLVNWPKLKLKLAAQRTCSGGYNARGLVIKITDYPKEIVQLSDIA